MVTLPDNLLYFVNPASGDVAEYTQLVEAYKASTGKALRHEAAEQGYDPASGKIWGFTGNNSTLRASTADIFQSLRYVNSSSERSLTYKFDLEKGNYTVYMGFYDPWFSSSQSKRVAHTLINGTTVETGRIINAAYAVAEHKGIVMNEAGTMEVTVAPANSGSNTDVQLSWIMIAKPQGEDGVKPVISLLGEATAFVEKGAVYTDAGATAADDRDGDITDRIAVSYKWQGAPVAAISTVTEATYSVHYNVSDSAGNAADEAVRTVIVKAPPVVSDTVEPVITLLGQKLVTLGVGADYTDAGAIASDDRDGDITNRISRTYSWNGLPAAGVSTVTEATYKVHYNVSDLAGNRAKEVTRTVVVATYGEPDTVRPVITLLGDVTVYVENGAEYLDAGAIAADDRDGNITDRMVVIYKRNGETVDAIDTLTAAAYTVHYNVADTAGNAAEEVTRTVVVKDPPILPDKVKPVITLLGGATVYVENGAEYLDAGAIAADDRDGNISTGIVTTITFGGKPVASVNTTAAGAYTYHYNVQDAAGNAAEEVTRRVIVSEAVDHSGGSNDEDTSTSTEPAPVPQQPADTQQLTREDLIPDGAGSFIVQLGKEKETLLLPAEVVSAVEASGTLRLVKDQSTFELSGLSLRRLLAEAGAEAKDGQIKITTVTEADSRLIKQAIEGASIPGAVYWTADSGLYRIQVEAVAKNGGPLNAAAASAKEKVVLTIKTGAAADPELLGLYAIGTDGKPVYMGGQWSNGEITAAVPLSGQYAVLAYARSFEDVADSHWANTVITRMAAKHIIDGVDEKTFEPQGDVTRAEFAAMLVRLLGLEASGSSAYAGFADVQQEAWYADAVAAAAQAGLVTGRSEGSFEPEGTVTRQEMAVMLVRAYRLKTEWQQADSAEAPFADADQIGAWAKDAVAAASAAGLLQGRGDGQFAPREQLTRAESVQVLYNLLKSLK
jgi:hypothetical protein